MEARIKCRHCGRTNELPVREANGDTLLCDFCHRVLAGTGVAEGSTKDIGRGERVRTTKDAGRTDFVGGAREKCRWGEEGVVLRRITGHGVCYRVLHEDGAEATYDYDEVMRLSDLCDRCREKPPEVSCAQGELCQDCRDLVTGDDGAWE